MSGSEKLVVNNLYHGLFLLFWAMIFLSYTWAVRLGFVEKDWLFWVITVIDLLFVFYHTWNMEKIK